MFDYGSYQWNNRNRANLIYWRGLVIIGNGLKNSYSSLSLRWEGGLNQVFTRFMPLLLYPQKSIACLSWNIVMRPVNGRTFPR